MSGRFIFFQDSSCRVGPNNTVEGRPGVTPDPRCPNESVHRTQPGSEDDPTVVMMRYISEVWISFPLVVFGIVGNLLSLFVLCQPRQRQKLRTIIILLRTLAVFDILVLVSIFLVRTMRYITPNVYMVFFSMAYPYLYPIAYELRLINTWLTVLLTIDRYVAVCRPLHAQRMCTVRRTYAQVAAVILLSVLFCLPRHFEYHIVYHSDGHYGFQTTRLIEDPTYTLVYRISLFLIVHYFAPTVILVWLNSLVIVALKRSDAYRSANLRRLQRYGSQPFGAGQPSGSTITGREAGPSSSAGVSSSASALQSTRGVTIVVVIVVCVCIVNHLVSMVAQVLYALETTFEGVPSIQSNAFRLVRRHVAQTGNVLLTFNSAVNFVIYCMCSRTFRSVLVAHVCCCFCGRRRTSSGATDGGTVCCFCCPRCLCWWCCCRDLPVDSLLVRLNRAPPVGPQSSTATNSTRSLTNSIMLSVMPNRIVKKRESLVDNHHDGVTCGPYRNQHTL